MKNLLSVNGLSFFLLLLLASPALLAQRSIDIDWEQVTELPAAADGKKHIGVAGAYSGVHQDILIIAGGANFPDKMPWDGGKKIYHRDIHLLKKDKDGQFQWIEGITQQLPEGAGYGGVVSTPGGIICIGGETENGPTDRVFRISRNRATGRLDISALPSLPVPLTSLSATNIGARIYVFGGLSPSGPSSKAFSLNLDAAQPVWEALPDAPSPFCHATVATQSNGEYPAIYLFGGRIPVAGKVSEIRHQTLRFDPKKKEWATRSDIGSPDQPMRRAAGTAIATGSNYVLLIGGDDGKLFNQFENFDLRIAAEKDEQLQQELREEKKKLQTNHPGFRRDVLLYNTITDTWTVADTLPFAVPVTTNAVKWDKDIFITSGEISPGVRTPLIIRGKIPTREFFSWIDSLVLLVCFLLMTIGRYAFTGKSDTANDYFKGGQRIPQWAAAVSIFGAKLSAITFMGIPAKTYATNWTYFFLLMSIVMVMPFVAKYFVPFYRQLNVTSAYEYLSKRFNNTARLIASSLYILLQLGRMAIVVLLPSIELTLVTGINVNICIFLIGAISIFFTVKGGIEAVIWVEVIQVIILATGAILCLIYIPTQLQDWPGAIDALKTHEKLKIFDFRFSFSEPTFWVVIIGGLAIQFLTYGTDQTTVQRYLTTRTEAEAVNSLRIGAWLTVPSTLIFFSIGTLLYLFFRENPEQVNIALDNQDNIFPWFIVSQLPTGLSGLLIAGIFAASMSSTEASMNSTATLLTADFYKKWKPAANEQQTLKFARIATFLLGVFTTCVALYMAHAGVSSLWDTFNAVLGLFTGCIGGAFILGIFTKRANANGVVAGMIFSGIAQILIQQFTHIHLLMYAFTGLAICVISGYIFSLLFTPATNAGATTGDDH